MLTRTLVCDSLNERYVACYLLYHKENWICKEILGCMVATGRCFYRGDTPFAPLGLGFWWMCAVYTHSAPLGLKRGYSRWTCRVSQTLPISVNLRKDSLTEVYDILNVRGAMNCATTNRQACKRRYELRDYEQESV